MDLALDEFTVSYDPSDVTTDQMFEAIKETGFGASLARSRVALTPAATISGALPALIQTALDEASSNGKRVFLDFYAQWCGACQIMDKTTFTDEAVKSVLEAGYIFVKVDTDEHPDIGRRFDVVGLPTVVVLGQSGDLEYRHTGPLKPEPLLKTLHGLNRSQ